MGAVELRSSRNTMIFSDIAHLTNVWIYKVLIHICLVNLFSLCYSAYADKMQCQKLLETCWCVYPDSIGVDLPNLNNQWYSAKEDNKTYWLRPCPLPVESDACPVGAMECVFNHTVGLDKVVELSDEHSNRMMAVQLKCDQSVPLVRLLQDLLVTRPNLCMATDDLPDETSHLSTGSVLVIMFFVFSSLYFVGGALALKLLRGAEGRELIPNYDFWVSLPGLVREGFLFTINGCQTPQAYDRI